MLGFKILRISFLVVLMLASVNAFSQNCYQRLQDASGLNVVNYQPNLETTACELKETLHEEFQGQFKVYDFGFYQHNEVMQGGFPSVFEEMIATVSEESLYYLLFGKQTDKNGVYTRFWVDFSLPDRGDMECIDATQINGLMNQINSSLNYNFDSPFLYANKEVQAMEMLGSFISKVRNCCYGGDGGLRMTEIDTSLLDIILCVDNPCSENEFSEHDVAIITSAPSMPQIAFRIEYSDNNICGASIKVELKIYYARNTPAATGRNRRDTITVTMNNIEMGYPYEIDYGDVQLWGRSWSVFQGGRAELSVFDNFDEKIKTFKFSIKAQNPTAQAVYAFVVEDPYDDYWFFDRILTHESGSHPTALSSKLRNFNPPGTRENLWTDWAQSSRCPNASANGDGGWGLGQLTVPIPDKQALWDWKANVHNAYHVLEGKKSSLESGAIRNYINRINTWNSNHPNDEVEGHADYVHGGITWVHALGDIYSSHATDWAHFDQTLQAGEHSFLDAMVLKRYNGRGAAADDREFYYLYTPEPDPNIPNHVPKPVWEIDPTAHYGGGVNRYVQSIARTQIPQN